jgi:hypothetical protein
MSFQAYLDNIQAKTGKTPADFAKLAGKLGLEKHGEIVAWLKRDFELGHGHASAVAAVLRAGERPANGDDRLDLLFSGRKAAWRSRCDRLLARLARFGPDFAAEANETYLNLLRGKRKFGILQPSAGRLDVGIKLPGAPPEGRFEGAGSWNAMVTHRVRITDPEPDGALDAELVRWLKKAWAVAGGGGR